MNWNEYFYYDETSPTFLRRLDGRIAGTFSSRSDGTKNGTVVKLKGKTYRVHRIIYELVMGELDKNMLVDHIDRNCWNNNKNNLRIVTKAINNRNRNKQRNNKTGITGITWVYVNNKTTVRAHVRIGNKTTTKSFNVNKHGLLPAFKMAFEWRLLKCRSEEYLRDGYTDNHGT